MSPGSHKSWFRKRYEPKRGRDERCDICNSPNEEIKIPRIDLDKSRKLEELEVVE